MTRIFLAAFLWTVLSFVLLVLYCAAVEGHRRGRARVHADRRSWQPRPTRATSPDSVVAEAEAIARWSA